MIKCLYFLLLVVASQAYVTREVQNTPKTIPRPVLNVIQAFYVPVSNDLAIKISWNAVPSNTVDPVLGYRLIVTEEISPNTNQPRNFQDIYVHGADKTIAAVAKLRRGVWYYCHVQAFTGNGFGQLSTRRGVKFEDLRNGERTPTYEVIEMGEEAEELNYINLPLSS